MMNSIKTMVFLLLITLLAGCATFDQQGQSEAEKEKLYTQYLQQGQAFEQQGNLSKALNEYKLALTVKPDDTETLAKRKNIETKLKIIANKHYKLGVRYKQNGNKKLARQEFLAALRYWPKHQKAIRMLKGKEVETQPEMSSQEVVEHIIKPGESLSKVAILYYGDYKKYQMIAKFNNLSDATQVKPGQKIRIPRLGDKPFLTSHKDDKIQVIQVPTPKQEQTQKQEDEVKQPLADTSESSTTEDVDLSVYSDEDLTEQPDSLDDIGSDQQEIGEQEELQSEKPVDEVANYRELGLEFFNEKNYDEAITEFQKVLNANPDDETAKKYIYLSYYQPAMVSFEKGNFMEAKRNFENALNIKKDCNKCDEYIKKSVIAYKEVHYNKGISYFEKELLAEAIREWELVSAIDPDYKGVQNNIHKAQTLLKRLEDIKKSMKE